MERISIEELEPGVIFTKNAYIEGGNLFALANTPVTEKDISRLKMFHIKNITTEGEMLPPGSMPQGLNTGGAKIKSEIREEDLLDIEDYFQSPLKDFDFEEEEKRLVNLGIDKDAVRLRNRAMRELGDIVESVRSERFFNSDIVKEIVNNFVIGIEKNRRQYLKLINKFIPSEYYISHSVNTCILSLIIGNHLGYTRIKQMSLGMGALLHDIGMAKLPPVIVNKEGKLTEKEYNIIRTHTLIGYKILSESGKFTKDVAMIVLQHHERNDGKGYPRKVQGASISDLTKIVQISSVYIALITKRSYREKHQYFDAMRHILNGCQGEFDPKFLKTFLSILSYYPIGSYVQLSDGRAAEVIMSTKFPMKPVVQIVLEQDGSPNRAGPKINLAGDTQIYIVKPVNSQLVEDKFARYFG